MPALERALASGRPSCVNVMTDPAVISPVTLAMVGGGGLGPPSEGSEKSEGSVSIPYYDNIES
jgi:hypothetical protein